MGLPRARLAVPQGGAIKIISNLSRSALMIKGSLGGETSVLRTFRMSGKELVKERVSQGKVS